MDDVKETEVTTEGSTATTSKQSLPQFQNLAPKKRDQKLANKNGLKDVEDLSLPWQNSSESLEQECKRDVQAMLLGHLVTS